MKRFAPQITIRKDAWLMRGIAAIVFAVCSVLTITYGAEFLVSAPDEVTAFAAIAQPGDTLLMRDGVWQNAEILFLANGTAARPVTLRAQTLGRVHLTGQSSLRMAGNFLVVEGLVFTNGFRLSGDVIAFRDSTSLIMASNSRLTNCAIIDYNPPDGTLDTKWVSLYGSSNRIDQCYFKDKVNLGTTLVVWVDTQPNNPNYHVISGNYFAGRPPLGTNGSNGGETIRVGTSDVSMNISRTTVEKNYFEQCNGDVEIISSKSCENVYRHNTFVDCDGHLSLRHGNRSVVEGNYFFGHNKTNTGGVRIIGEDHKVYNNYFQDLAGTSTRAPLSIMQGLVDSPLNGYFQVYRATVAFNTFVNCTNAMIIGLSGTLTGATNVTSLPPVDCVIANNLIVQPAGKVVDQRITPVNLTWEGNNFYGATLNIATNSGISRVNPQLVLAADGLWRPNTNSPALGAAQGNYPFVTNDFEGQARLGSKDVGSDQFSGQAVRYPPQTAGSVGPLWMRLAGTYLSWAAPADIAYGTPLSSAELNATANAAGTLAYTPPAGTILNTGTGQVLTVVFTPDDVVNFNALTQTVAINVVKAAPQVSWTSPNPITFGTALGPAQLNATSNVPGSLLYLPPAGTVLGAGIGRTLGVTFVPTDTNNYLTRNLSVSIDVAKATPVVTWNTPAPVERSTALSAAQLNATANAQGAFSYSPPSGTVLAAGSGQPLSVTFTPSDSANYDSTSRTVFINVTIGGKTLPAITWPAPAPILFGTPLGSSQLNATASVPGTLTYSPGAGTILAAGSGQALTVTFRPFDTLTYTSAVKTVAIDVAAAASSPIIRVAYVIPTNRVAQGHAVATLRNSILLYQGYFADQMERNGFGRKTFVCETEADGVTPLINLLPVAETDVYLRGDLNGQRLLDTARTAGLPVGAAGQIWWLIAETHAERPDGSIGGSFEMASRIPALPADSGWVISGSDYLALFQTLYQTNALLYDGYIVPELGPYPLAQDVSFAWFEGITLSGVSSSAVGSALRGFGEALGLAHDFRNDENFNGNLMGFGFRGIRGVFYPERYPYNYCGLSYASALALNVNPYFNGGRLVTDVAPPSVSIMTSGARDPVEGLLQIAFTASDDHGLQCALLTWQTDSDVVMAQEMVLSGRNASGTFAIPYFVSQQTNRYTLTVFDEQGNRGVAQTSIYPTSSPNHSPEPFLRVSPVLVGLGEDVVLDVADSFDLERDSSLLEVEWDLDGDGTFDTLPDANLVLTTNYATLGTRLVRARLTDPAGNVAISAPVAVSVVVCPTSLSPTNKSHGYGGSTGTVTVTTSPKCRWTAVNSNDWITIIGVPEFVGSGKMQYFVAANPFFSRREGTLFIGDQAFIVSQDPAICTYSVSPASKFHGYGIGTGSFKVSTKTNCVWTAVSTEGWITITSGASGTNTGNVSYSILDHRVTGRRSGNIVVNGTAFTLNQWGTNCETVISPASRVHSETPETNQVTVNTSGECSWSAFNTNSWITITPPDSGTGSGTLSYTVAPNLGASARTGVVMVNDQPFVVTQQVCGFNLSDSGHTHGSLAESGMITVTAGAICPWNVDNTNDWITINSAPTNTGPGVVTYAISANPRGDLRSGILTVAGINFSVAQFGKSCEFAIDPLEASVGEAGDYGEIFVSAEAGCAWTVSNPVSWISIIEGQSSEGNGLILYSVDANFGPARSATLTIGSGASPESFTIWQPSGIRNIAAGDGWVFSGQTNFVSFSLEAHGGENKLAFSVCYETNLLSFTSARLPIGSTPGATLTVNTNQAGQGHVGLTITMPDGWSMPEGTGMVVQVYFRGAEVDGKRTAAVSACDAPIARALLDALGRPLTATFATPEMQVIGFCSLAESVDAPQMNWTNSAIPWSCQTNVTHDGEDAAVSGPTPDNGISYFETTVIGPGLLSFWWKVSSEPSNDRLRLYLDATEQFRISGEVDWEWRTLNVPAGNHLLRWHYSKNGSSFGGSDRGWIDQIVYEPAPPVVTVQPVSQTVDQGSNVTLTVSAAGQPPLSYQWLSNNIAISDAGNIRGAQTGTLTVSNAQPANSATYSVVVGNTQGNVTSSNAVLSVTQLVPLPDALNATSFVWSNSGTAAWVGQTAVSHDGAHAGRSGNITHSQSSSFQTTVIGPGTIWFWWKVSSEPSNDKLTFYTNGSSQASISGEVGWQEKSFSVGAGTQTLLWTYAKNSSVSSGQDRAWVDEFRFDPAPPVVTTQPGNQLVDQGATAVMSVIASGKPPLSYQWFANGSSISGATNSALTLSNIQPVQAGNYSVSVANTAGSAASSNALVQVNHLVPLGEALDATNLVWTTNGAPPWVGQTMVNRDGSDAARSGAIGNSATNSFQTTVVGPGTLSFWWKVSSETNKDYLRFYSGGALQESISGEVEWTWRSWAVPSGSQALDWRYTKSSSSTAGQDAGWVDQVHYIPASTPAPPFMVIQPTNRVGITPANMSFNVLAAGTAPLAYQWLVNGVALTNGGVVSGATTTNLTLTGAGAAQSGNYCIIVTNAAGVVTSAVATLTMIAAPVITNPPASQNVLLGSTVNFSVTAVGSTPMTYQWLLNGSNLSNAGNVSGVTTTNLRLTSVTATQAGSYTVVASNSAGVMASAAAMLTVSTAPGITSQPANQTAIAGNIARFSVTNTGSAPLSYRWRFNGTNLIDADSIYGSFSSVLVLSNVSSAATGAYSVVITNPVGAITSSNAALTVLVPPSLTTLPTNQTVGQGGTASFVGVAAGTPPLSYHWRRNGTNLVNGGSMAGATNATLTISAVQPSQAGTYTLEISNAAGVVVSAPAQLTVLAAMTLGEAVNAPYLTWGTDIETPWIVLSNVTHDGEAAARNGAITNGDSTWIETSVTGPGTIRFWWKVSSQTNADVLSFTVGGAIWASISGEVDWHYASFSIPAGTMALRWTYAKDAGGTNGQDRAWLDEVDFAPATGPSSPAIVLQPHGNDVDPGATVTFSVQALGTAPLNYQWRLDGQELADGASLLGAKSPTLTLLNVQPSQAGLYDVVVKNPYSLALSEQAFLNVIEVIPLAVALDTDATNLVWLTGGFSPWRGQGDYNADRIDAAQSGPLPSSQTNWIKTTVSGPGAISFWWKVSSETNHDRLRFLINGVEQTNISGEVDWRERTYFVPNANSALQWSYTKDASNSAGLDRGWVDLVSFGPSAPIITNFGPDITYVDQGTTVKLSVDASGTPPFSYQWEANNTNLVNSDTNVGLVPGFIIGATGNHRLTISNAQPSQSGIYVANVINQAGIAVSAPMSVEIIPAPPLGLALNTNLVWDTGGFSWWVGTTNVTHDGVMAARNGTLPASQATWMRTTVTGPGTLSFWWKASTETNADFLMFRINGTEQVRISGEQNWQKKTYDLNDIGAAYAFEWEYSKNSLFTNGLDQVFVDEVIFASIVPIITNQPVAQTTIDAGASAAFSVSVRGTPPLFYQWLLEGNPLSDGDTILGATNATLRLTGAQVSQSGIYTLLVTNDVGWALSSNALLTVIPIFPLADALETTNITWTAGSPAWVGQPVVTHDGVDAARSPALLDGQSATMQTTIVGPGTASFWWKVSSETNNDKLTFYTNTTALTNISGEVGWQQRSFTIGAGSHTLKWTYSKNASISAGQNRGWVDQFVFTPVPPTVTKQPSAITVDQGTPASFSVTVAGTPPFTYEWLRNGVGLTDGDGITGANSGTLVISNTELPQGGNYYVIIGNAAGTITSSSALLTVTPTVPLDVALDTSNLVWTISGSNGSPNWVGQMAVSHDGIDAARIAGVTTNGSATFQTTLTGPGSLSFWWKVSCETNNDKLLFYVNSTEQARISGEAGWQSKSFTVGSGTQTLKWIYTKNGTTNGGQDRAWVDQVAFTPLVPTITAQPTNLIADAGTTANFSVAISGTPPFSYQWQLDGVGDLVNGGGISGATSSNLVLTNVQTSQAGTYRVVVQGPGGSVVSTGSTLAVFPILTLNEALDAPALVWTTNGAPPWIGHGAVTHDGSDAARSGAIGNSASNSMTTVITGPGTVSFWWKVSSETNKDLLLFYTNGVEAARISGETDWQFKSLALGSGSQALTWMYFKNSSISAGQDRGWVDQVSFGPVPPTITAQPANQSIEAGSTASLAVAASGTPPFTYQWQFNNVNLADAGGISGANTTNLVVSSAQVSQAGTYRVIIIGPAGTATSAGSVLAVYPLLPLAEALDTPAFIWTTNGTPASAPPWAGQGIVTHDGIDAARSGAIGNSASNSMSTVVNGPGTVSFWWKISSETNNDKMVFYTNNVEAARVSGEVNWQIKTFDLAAGSQTLRWTYSKNGTTTAGQDRAWVDQVQFGVIAPTITAHPANAMVDPGTAASFTVAAVGTAPFSYRWLYNGAPLIDAGGINGATNATLMVSNVQLGRIGSYSVIVSNSAGVVASSAALLGLNANITLDAALDGGLTFTTGGTGQPWKGQQNVTRDGMDAAETGAVTDSTYTWIKTTVTGPGPLTFWWKVSSETNHDYLRFMLDAVDQVKISGEVDWQQVVFTVPSGSHELQWRYSRNASLAVGQDKGWVDQAYFGTNPPVIVDPPAILIHPVSQTADAGDTVSLSVAAASSYPLAYRWFFNGTNLLQDSSVVSGAATAQLTLMNVAAEHAGNYLVVVSNIGGAVPSGSARLTINPAIDLAEAVDTLDLFVTTDGDTPWIGQTVVTHDGVDAAHSGAVANGQHSDFHTMANGPGTVCFWWKVSSQTNAGLLTFSVNGVPQASISGEVDWRQRFFHLTNGAQLLDWTYSKNASGASGADRGWVDQLFFLPDGASGGTNAPSTSVGLARISIVSSKARLTWLGSASKIYKVFYKDDLSQPDWTEFDGEILLTWQVVDGVPVPDSVVATCEDVLAGRTRFYRVQEY